MPPLLICPRSLVIHNRRRLRAQPVLVANVEQCVCCTEAACITTRSRRPNRKALKIWTWKRWTYRLCGGGSAVADAF